MKKNRVLHKSLPLLDFIFLKDDQLNLLHQHQFQQNAEADDIILQDTIQLSLVEQISHDELEAQQNVQKAKEHLLLRRLRNWLEPRSNKKSLNVEIIIAEQPVNVIEEEEESAEDDYKLRRREKGKHVEESRSTPSPITIRSPRTHYTLISSDTEKLLELTVTDPPPSSLTPSSSLRILNHDRFLSL
nr:hypothetical protein [Tanacetum cinerariifolium]